MKETIIIDAEGAVAGRLASYTAKQLLLGKKIAIINSNKAIIIGDEKNITSKYLSLRRKGGSAMKGPLFPSSPERILKRMIRGMLPKKKGRGEEAIKRIRCYNETPEEYKDQRVIKSSREPPIKSITLKELSSKLKHKHD